MSLTSYCIRNKLLREMGYSSYKAYLESQLWKEIRRRVLHGNCRICRNPGQVLHHLRYSAEVLHGRDDKSLIVLCHACHTKIEIDSSGKKRSLYAANGELFRLSRLPPRKKLRTRYKYSKYPRK